MRHRSGATLVEVLVAIFVTGVGLLALLALFPLGALTMAQAIKDDRTATAAGNAASIGETHAVRQSPYWFEGAPDPFIEPKQAPGAGFPAPAHADLPGYPVFIDPFGFQLFESLTGIQGPPKIWVGGYVGVPRRSLRFIHKDPITSADNTSPVRSYLTASWFSLLDDITFLKDGPSQGFPCPPGSPPGAVQREGKYSWAYMARRPRSIETKVVDLTVVVYASRPSTVPVVPSAQQVLGEPAYDTPQRPSALQASDLYSNRDGKSVLTVWVKPGQEKPPLRKGGWVLDASVEMVGAPPGSNGWAHGSFYRVVGISEPFRYVPRAGEPDDPPNYLRVDLELQTPLREAVDTITPANNEFFTLPTGTQSRSRIGRIIVPENVAEVFEKGVGWMP